MISCCSICYDLKDPETGHYYTPTPEQRRDIYFKEKKKLSHGYCPACFILKSEEDGYSKSELEEILNKVNNQK
jgi:hypothetical protein